MVLKQRRFAGRILPNIHHLGQACPRNESKMLTLMKGEISKSPGDRTIVLSVGMKLTFIYFKADNEKYKVNMVATFRS